MSPAQNLTYNFKGKKNQNPTTGAARFGSVRPVGGSHWIQNTAPNPIQVFVLSHSLTGETIRGERENKEPPPARNQVKRPFTVVGKMRRPGHYTDSGMNQMVAAQMQHAQAQRLQHNSGMGHCPGRADSLQADEENQYMSSKAEGQWQWDRDEPKGSNVMSSHMYKEGQGSDVSRSSYQGQRPDPKQGMEKQGNKDSRAQAHAEDMEVAGYEGNALPQTFEGLEQKFIQDIMKLTKEQQNSEDIENARHRERISEINAQYQEKLLAIRARQATRREEFLRKESQSRHQQYQQASMNTYQNSSVPSDAHGVGSNANSAAGALADAHQAYGAGGNYESYGERSGFGGGSRDRGYEPRGQYPGGRAYNSGGRYF